MDRDPDWSYNRPTLFQEWKKVFRKAETEQKMDKDFLRQIDELGAFAPSETAEKLDDDFLICECFCVSAGDIRMACGPTGKVNLEIIQHDLHLGQGCQGCLRRLDTWIDKIF